MISESESFWVIIVLYLSVHETGNSQPGDYLDHLAPKAADFIHSLAAGPLSTVHRSASRALKTEKSDLTKGHAEFTVKHLKAGYRAFSVLGTVGKGNIRPSNPVLAVVRKLAATSQ
jgi:hypothetical protein